MDRKASIELSINFLVIIIISLIVMGMGVVLVRNMIVSGNDNIVQVDDKLRAQLEGEMMEDGKPISIPFIQKTIKRGDTDIFAIGVLNLLNDQESGPSDSFGVTVKFSMAVDLQTGEQITFEYIDPPPDETYNLLATDELLNFDNQPVSINKNEVHVFSVPIRVAKDAPSGEYIYNVYVCYDDGFSQIEGCSAFGGSTYGLYDDSIHKLYVKVP